MIFEVYHVFRMHNCVFFAAVDAMFGILEIFEAANFRPRKPWAAIFSTRCSPRPGRPRSTGSMDDGRVV